MKFKLFKITSKVTQLPTKDNGYIMVNEEIEKELMKGTGPTPPPTSKIWEAIEELRGAMGEILTEMRSGFKTVFQFIEEQKAVNAEQKTINAEVKDFIAEQKAVNAEQKAVNAEQKEVNKQQAEFNIRIEAKVDKLEAKTEETSEKLDRVIKLNKLKSYDLLVNR